MRRGTMIYDTNTIIVNILNQGYCLKIINLTDFTSTISKPLHGFAYGDAFIKLRDENIMIGDGYLDYYDIQTHIFTRFEQKRSTGSLICIIDYYHFATTCNESDIIIWEY